MTLSPLLSPGRALVAVLFVAACRSTSPPTPEATSLLGQPLHAPEHPPERRRALEADLAAARAAHEANPGDADALVWVGRRLGYLGRYREAIAVFTRGLALHPSDARFLRHRGHRSITLRDFDRAIADLSRAAELIEGQPDPIEPDGQPNRLDQPRTTLRFNVYYHLGLAHFLKGDYLRALAAYQECMKVSRWNDDSLCATTDWLYMTLRRLGRHEEAAALLPPIRETMDILENDAYHRRLLMYKGLLRPEALLDPASLDDVAVATQGFGVASWYLANGERQRAIELLRRVVAGRGWAAFGYIAAEADLARAKGGDL